MSTNSHPLIALSVGDSQDLHYYGYGPEHVDEAVLRIASMLLESRFRIGFGGDLRDGGFTEALIEVTKGAVEEAVDPRLTNAPPEKPLDPEADPVESLVAFQAWPYYFITKEAQRAQLHGAVRFIRVDAEGWELRPEPENIMTPDNPEDAWCTAKALQRMRDLMSSGGEDDYADFSLRGTPSATPRSRARIAIGGKVTRWQGMAPGVAEEISCDLHQSEVASHPATEAPAIFLIGAFGGCARAIAQAILEEHHEGTARTSIDHLAFLRRDAHLPRIVDPNAPKTPYQLTEAGAALSGSSKTLQNRIDWVREKIDSIVENPDRLNNGLSRDDNLLLMRTEDVGKMRQLIMRGLRKRRLLPLPAGSDERGRA